MQVKLVQSALTALIGIQNYQVKAAKCDKITPLPMPFDIEAYMGRWYNILRTDIPGYERQCITADKWNLDLESETFDVRNTAMYS